MIKRIIKAVKYVLKNKDIFVTKECLFHRMKEAEGVKDVVEAYMLKQEGYFKNDYFSFSHKARDAFEYYTMTMVRRVEAQDSSNWRNYTNESNRANRLQEKVDELMKIKEDHVNLLASLKIKGVEISL
jgi:hypothetical protein